MSINGLKGKSLKGEIIAPKYSFVKAFLGVALLFNKIWYIY